MDVVDIGEKLSQFTECWRPKIIATLNGQEVKVVKLQGEFPWHRHEDIDEMFLGWKGTFQLEF